MIAEELLDTSLLVREGCRVVTNGCPAALARLVAVADVWQVRPRLPDHVEGVDRARVEDDRGVRPPAAPIGPQLGAGGGEGRVGRGAPHRQQRPGPALAARR